MIIEEIVYDDEPDTEDDGFETDLDYEEEEDLGEYENDYHRRLKKVKVKYTQSRSAYTKTTKTNVYYKPPVYKKVYVPPVYKKV